MNSSAINPRAFALARAAGEPKARSPATSLTPTRVPAPRWPSTSRENSSFPTPSPTSASTPTTTTPARATDDDAEGFATIHSVDWSHQNLSRVPPKLPSSPHRAKNLRAIVNLSWGELAVNDTISLDDLHDMKLTSGVRFGRDVGILARIAYGCWHICRDTQDASVQVTGLAAVLSKLMLMSCAEHVLQLALQHTCNAGTHAMQHILWADAMLLWTCTHTRKSGDGMGTTLK